MPDRIVYKIVTKAGGVDGMDKNDKGGQITFASFDKAEAEKYIGNDTRYKLEKIVIDTDEVTKGAMNKLTKIEQLIVGPLISSNTR